MFLSPFLAVQASFWPILSSVCLCSCIINFVLFVNLALSPYILFLSVFFLVLTAFLWWKDLWRESMIGYHTHKLQSALRISVLLFILSEVFFFISFFWAFYDSSLAPTVELGMVWPPKGILPLSTYSVPLLNTVILLSRGVTVTWAHYSIMTNHFSKAFVSLFITVILGIYFLYMQFCEYHEAVFSMADGVYGRTFFMATGFHGLHVFIGMTFLLVVLLSLYKLVPSHHFSFEAAAWYWHFVDVVWLILFISIYWWGGLGL